MIIAIELNSTCLSVKRSTYCFYCSYLEEMRTKKEDVEEGTMEKALKILMKKFRKSFFVFSGKEPLKDKKSIRRLLYFSNLFKRNNISQVGLILSPLYIESLYNIRHLINLKLNLEISINSLKERIHESTRGYNGEFSVIKKEILEGNKFYRFAKEFSDNISISTVIFKENINEIYELVKILYDKGINFFSFGTIKGGIKKNLGLNSFEIKKLVEKITKLAEDFKEIKVTLTIYPLSVLNIEKLFLDLLNPNNLIFEDLENYNYPYISILENFKIIPLIGAFSIGHTIRIASYGLAIFSTHPSINISFPYTNVSLFEEFLNIFYPSSSANFYLLWKPVLTRFENREFRYPFV